MDVHDKVRRLIGYVMKMENEKNRGKSFLLPAWYSKYTEELGDHNVMELMLKIYTSVEKMEAYIKMKQDVETRAAKIAEDLEDDTDTPSIATHLPQDCP